MKNLSDKNKYILAAVGFIAVLALGIFLIARVSSISKQSDINREEIDKISLQTEGGNLTVYRNGSVEYDTANGLFTDNWTPQKTNAFFEYFEKNYLNAAGDTSGNLTFSTSTGGQSTNYNPDDELIGAVIDDVTGNNDEGDDNGDIGDFFNTPTPGPGGTPAPTPTPASSGNDECLYWKVSYCVIKKTPTPTPSPAPEEESVAVEPSCTVDENRQTGRTVISSQLCVPTPTP